MHAGVSEATVPKNVASRIKNRIDKSKSMAEREFDQKGEMGDPRSSGTAKDKTKASITEFTCSELIVLGYTNMRARENIPLMKQVDTNHDRGFLAETKKARRVSVLRPGQRQRKGRESVRVRSLCA